MNSIKPTTWVTGSHGAFSIARRNGVYVVTDAAREDEVAWESSRKIAIQRATALAGDNVTVEVTR